MSSYRLALVPVLVGVVCSGLIHSMVIMLTPVIVSDFSSPELYGWVNGVYFICSVAAMIVTAPISDRIGARKSYVFGMTTYVLGTVLAGIGSSIQIFLFARFVQGLGAGVIAPAALLLVGHAPKDMRGPLFGLIGLLQIVAQILGLVLGAALVNYLSWRFGFLFVIPFIVGSIVLAARFIPVVKTEAHESNSRFTLRLVPKLQIFIFTKFFFLSAIAGALIASVVTYTPWAMNAIHGMNPSQIGFQLFPLFVAAALGSLVGGYLSDFRWTLFAAFALTLIGVLLLANGSVWGLCAGSVLIVFGCGVSLPIILTHTQSLAPVDQIATVSSWIQVGRNVGAAVMVPVLGSFIFLPVIKAGLCMVAVAAVVTVGGMVLARSSS